MAHDRNYGADTERLTRPGTFRPGNPGRPAGARNRATLAAMALLEGEAEALTRRCVELALAGDTTAMRMCLERLLPKGRAVRLQLPMRTLADLDAATETVSTALAGAAAVAEGVAPARALLSTRRRVLETPEFERYL